MLEHSLRLLLLSACRYVPGSLLQPGVNEIILLEVEFAPRGATGQKVMILSVVYVFRGIAYAVLYLLLLAGCLSFSSRTCKPVPFSPCLQALHNAPVRWTIFGQDAGTRWAWSWVDNE